MSPVMKAKRTMVYWKSKKFWLGKLVEHPEIMTQGRTLKELEENIQDAYRTSGILVSGTDPRRAKKPKKGVGTWCQRAVKTSQGWANQNQPL